MPPVLRLLPPSHIWRETEARRAKERQRERRREGTTEKKKEGRRRGRREEGSKQISGGGRDLALGVGMHEPSDLQAASTGKASSTVLDIF